jgi:microcystin-dependent protein
MPQHVHVVGASTASTGGNDNPTNRFLGSASNVYHTPASLQSISPGTIANAGGSQAHLNMQPFLTLTFAIALQGIFPSQN